VSEPGKETGDPAIVLRVLTSIERDSSLSQRKLAGDLGIALGLANAYLRRCVRKGFVKVSQVPLNRYAYYLTPQGFAEKSRLTATYLSASLTFFRRARGECASLFGECTAAGWRRAALYGASDLAEIAVLSAVEGGIELVCIIDASKVGRQVAGLPVVADLAEAQQAAGPEGLDGIILTDTSAPQAAFDLLLVLAHPFGFGVDTVLAPSVLGIRQ
jgi:DNA-binding MarR family transcriptional regulator